MNINKILFTALLLSIVFFQNSIAQENKKIDYILSQKRVYNKNNRKAKGYKIQLYNGNETTAYRTKRSFETEFNIVAELTFETSEWKVRVGNYKTKLEADRAVLEFEKEFTGIFVLEMPISL